MRSKIICAVDSWPPTNHRRRRTSPRPLLARFKKRRKAMPVSQMRRERESGDASDIGRAVRTGHGGKEFRVEDALEYVLQFVPEANVLEAHRHELPDGQVDLCAQQHLAEEEMARQPQRHPLDRRWQFLVHTGDHRCGTFIILGRRPLIGIARGG